MTQEEKELLIEDLCARLPYGVKVSIERDFPNNPQIVEKIAKDGEIIVDGILAYDIYYYKPYLRPISSMTEEEKDELFNIWKLGKDKGLDSVTKLLKDMFNKAINENCFLKLCTSFENWIDVMTWFNKHHFDYRGLIEKGLVLEALEEYVF